MYFQVKNTLKNNHNHTLKHTVKLKHFYGLDNQTNVTTMVASNYHTERNKINIEIIYF